VNKLVRKLTTIPVWWLETHRPYPIRNAWHRLPPVPVSSGPTTLVVLTRPDTFNDALWAMWSWLRFLKDEVQPEIQVDGPITDTMRRSLNSILPGCGLFEAGATVRQAGPFPTALDDFILRYPLGRKFGLLLALQQRGPVLYADADVLCFNPPTELQDALRASATGAYLPEEGEGHFFPALVERARSLGFQPLPALNSGLLLVRPGSLSIETANELLSDWTSLPRTWFLEQTALACLLSAGPMTALPRNRYKLTTARQFYPLPDVDYARIVARHFTTPTRHVMYGQAMPWILRQLEGTAPA
jgi:hypothetical protein